MLSKMNVSPHGYTAFLHGWNVQKLLDTLPRRKYKEEFHFEITQSISIQLSKTTISFLPKNFYDNDGFAAFTVGNPSQKLQLEGNVPEMCFLVITNLHLFSPCSQANVSPHGYTAFLPWMECPKAFRYATLQYSTRDTFKMIQFVPTLVTPDTILLMWNSRL
ncbi:hypothetical protein CEXT_774121 [Caerostris extrusa]|uniref:Uncharacterized protein n=1 Tax=Caerostris extrusa TaxID=172846 RepID=A0AAV4NHQ0_CAEEX|nr:hypothetical protein CEXT_774121 [Caerostris extrusa]